MDCTCDAQKKLANLERIIQEAAKYAQPDNDARAPESPLRQKGRARVLAWLTSQREKAGLVKQAAVAVGIPVHRDHTTLAAVFGKCSDDELMTLFGVFTTDMRDAGLISARTEISSVPKEPMVSDTATVTP